MNNLYDILNIENISLDKKIEKAILETKDVLKDLIEERTCKIYTSYLYDNLVKNHVVCKKINTKELGYNYEHHFILIPINNEESYIADLTFSQFKKESKFTTLLNKGYQKISNVEYIEYLSIVTNEAKISLIDEAYNNDSRIR